jgi:arsenite methyltransferase
MFTSLFLKILNKEASSEKSKPADIIASLNIREENIIADIGSGGGYFTLAFAGKAGKTGRESLCGRREAEVSGFHTTQGDTGRV